MHPPPPAPGLIQGPPVVTVSDQKRGTPSRAARPGPVTRCLAAAAAGAGPPDRYRSRSDGDRLPTRRRRVAVRGTRTIGLADMVRNSRTGDVRVDPRTGAVTLDGQRVQSGPAQSVPLSRLYFL